jgi:hypothetical protein
MSPPDPSSDMTGSNAWQMASCVEFIQAWSEHRHKLSAIITAAAPECWAFRT